MNVACMWLLLWPWGGAKPTHKHRCVATEKFPRELCKLNRKTVGVATVVNYSEPLWLGRCM